jgi:hypothetical protein
MKRVLLGTLLALCCACGPVQPAPCSATTCADGCCGPSGCMQACGTKGTTCVFCGAQSYCQLDLTTGEGRCALP